MEIQAGDLVKLKVNAKYYDGTKIPEWVKKDRWIVASVSGDRAVIDKNKKGTKSICSPVNVKHLKKVSLKNKGANKPEPAQATASPSSENMTISEQGVELVAKYEGCRLGAYKCPAGVWTIGYGHTAGVKPGDRLSSKEQAKALLREDLATYADSVNNCIKNGMISFSVTQNQFDALTSFCYNCGAGSLQTLVSGRSAEKVAESILLYNKGGGKVLPGLERRRKEERALFLK